MVTKTPQIIMNEALILIFIKKSPEQGIGADFSLLRETMTRQQYLEILGGDDKADKWIKKYHSDSDDNLGFKLAVEYLLKN